MEKVPFMGHELHRWQCGPSSFLAYPEKGARLMNWNIRLGDGSVRDVIFWPETRSMDEFWRTRGGNPILFPFSARCFEGGEIHFWRDADGVRRPMPMHGLARQGNFRITRLDARGFAAQFEPDAQAHACFPFDYEFEVTYRFEAFSLACEFTLRNRDKVPIPWSAGHHFYFTVPWSEGSSRSDYLIHLPSSKTLKQDTANNGTLIPGPTLSHEESLANPALIDTIHTGLRSNTVIFGEKGRPGDIHVKLGSAKTPHPDYSVVTWAESDSCHYYCVEPWMGPPNAPGTKQGLHFVQPGQSQSFLVTISVK